MLAPPNATFMEIPIFHLELHRNKSWIFHPAMLDRPSLDRKGLTVSEPLIYCHFGHSTVVFKTHFYKKVTDVSLFVPKPSFASKSTSRFGGVFVQQVSYRTLWSMYLCSNFCKRNLNDCVTLQCLLLDHVQLLCGSACPWEAQRTPKLSGFFRVWNIFEPAYMSFHSCRWVEVVLRGFGVFCLHEHMPFCTLRNEQVPSWWRTYISTWGAGWTTYVEHWKKSTWNLPCFAGRQTAMFSATFGTGVQHLAADFLDSYTFVAVGRVGSAAQTVEQRLILWVEGQGGKRSQWS